MYYEIAMTNISAQINTRHASFSECLFGVFANVNTMLTPDYRSHLRYVLSI